ncbi:MAG: hypothetical protein HN757_07195 [Calditrichaeota bacterium]|nr:hypothetical protein [Calditrichota bacterium]
MTATSNELNFENLGQNQNLAGFKTLNLYTDGSDRAMGARFVSIKTGYIVDLVRIQSVPQGFFWVKTPPKWDKGEPHTCEHLLLGKGSVGKAVAALEEMSLGNSSAYTAQLMTAYHFNTTAGEDAFYKLFHAKLNALMHPDFTDEEVRREVCHVGVTVNPEDGSLSLEEKGTVYTEMVSGYEKHWNFLWDPLSKMQYGDNHPVINSSGGDPKAIREMVPEDMWSFHGEFHQLENMGAIVSIPDEIGIEQCLDQLDKILTSVQNPGKETITYDNPESINKLGMSKYDFPEPKMAEPSGLIKTAEYPGESTQGPGYIAYGWRPELDYGLEEELALNLFLGSFSNGESSNLYDYFINSQTREADLGITSVGGSASRDMGHPITFSFDLNNNAYVTEENIGNLREKLIGQIKEVYDYADGSDELQHFNNEVQSLLENRKKRFTLILDSPPMFGFRRGRAGAWFFRFKQLEKVDGFRKSVVGMDRIASLEKQLETGNNFWREYIDGWKLLTVEPYAVGVTPNPELIEKSKLEKEIRLAGYVDEFKLQYGVEEDAKAIALYKEEFDQNTKALEEQEKQGELPKFIDNPPMSYDEQLNYEVLELQGEIPFVVSSFDHMSSSTIGVAMGMNVVEESDLVYVTLLPAIMSRIGVIKDSEVIEFEEMQTRLRREVLGVQVYVDANMSTGRIELVVRGLANNREEIPNVIGWMETFLSDPLLTQENLPRMLDIIDQYLVGLRQTMKRGEESWVDDPTNAYRLQKNPLYLSTSSFLTKVHNLQRLRWMLTETGNRKARNNLEDFLDHLEESGAGKSREELISLLDSQPDMEIREENEAIVKRIVRELKSTLPEIPDENLSTDWEYLCEEIEEDLEVKPEKALKSFKRIIELLQKADNARMFMISSSDDREASLADIKKFSERFSSKKSSKRVKYSDNSRITEQLESRVEGDFTPTYVGLVNENTRNGVLLLSNQYTNPFDENREAILDALASRLYSGYAGHGVFMQTWASGLAYSNGIRFRDGSGRIRYYAERCPDIAETMRFVVGVIQKEIPVPAMTEYVTALCFGHSRSSDRYETRGEAMASDLADGFTPEVISNYRQKILDIKDTEGLYEELKSRLPGIYGRVLVGYGDNLAEHEGGNNFMIGPEEQFESWENYISSVEFPQPVYRLYPRDYWLRR